MKWLITFRENGDEYTGSLIVTADLVVQIDQRTFVADNVMVEIDEAIVSIQKVEE